MAHFECQDVMHIQYFGWWDQFKLTSQLTTHLISQCHFKHLPSFVKPSSFGHFAVQRARACKFETICQR